MAISTRIPMFRRQWLAITGGVGLLAVAMAGCAKAPPAAEVALTHDPSEPTIRRSMTDDDQRKVESAFDSLAAGQTPTQLPRPAGKATYGQRWEDVDAAVRYACDETEMAVVGSSAVTGGNNNRDIIGWEFRLRTVEDWPGILKIKRVALDANTTSAQRVYEAQAEIGAFGDRTDRANALLDALDKQLTAFGRKLRLAE